MGRFRAALNALRGIGTDADSLKARSRAANRQPPITSDYGYSWFPGTGGTGRRHHDEFDYIRAADRLDLNGVVRVCLSWLGDNHPTAMIRVGKMRQRGEDRGQYVPNLNHDFNAIMRRPNPHFTMRELWWGAISGYKIDGNAYWFKVRANDGSPVQLWWVPNHLVTVVGSDDPRRLIDCYRVEAGRGRRDPEWRPEDVIHFRDAPDPENPIVGLGRLKAHLRSIAGLNTGDTYTAAILRNAHAGKILTPKDSVARMDPYEESELLGAGQAIRRGLMGEGSGGIHLSQLPMDLHDVGMGPEQMRIDTVLDRPEAMVCAAMGVNSLVLGLPSSRDSRTYSNIAEARQAAWEDGIVPMQDAFAETLQNHLLYYTDPITGEQTGEWGDPPGLEVWWDRSEVPALKEDEDARITRWSLLWEGNAITWGQYRDKVGLPPLETDDERAELLKFELEKGMESPDDEPEPVMPPIGVGVAVEDESEPEDESDESESESDTDTPEEGDEA